jgi:hypothetical protein
MDRRSDEERTQQPRERLMEHVPQEPIAADPREEGEPMDLPEGDDEEEADPDWRLGRPVQLEDEDR